MAIELTKKQTLILDYIKHFLETNNYSPSYREIMEGVGLTSVSAVSEHIDNLVAKGAIKKVPGAARSLEITEKPNQETVELFQKHFINATKEDREILKRAAEILPLVQVLSVSITPLSSYRSYFPL